MLNATQGSQDTEPTEEPPLGKVFTLSSSVGIESGD